MSEIAQLTFNGSNDFYEIMDMLDKRLNDKGKNWRHVLKSLKVLDYCLHEGSELVVTWARKNVYIIKTLREFQYVDDDGRDVGQNGTCEDGQFHVRQSAKELTSLVLDEERLRTERSDRKTWKSRVTGIEEFAPRGYDGDVAQTQRRRAERRPQRADEEDAEYKLAIEASKYEAEEDKKRRDRNSVAGADDDDLAKAIKLSKEEEELRRKELEESNASSLFDDAPAPSSQQPQYTGYNQGYQQQGAVDWFGNPVDQQQPQNTGYLNNVYSQPTGQNTGFQNGFPQQQNNFDQAQIPQQNQQTQQPNYFPQQNIQPQQTAFNSLSNPYAQQQPQQNEFGQQFQQQQQQQQQFNPPQAGTHNPWASQQQQQPESLNPTPTGSNNPFASSFNRPQPQKQNSSPPSLNTLAEQRPVTQFNPITSYQAPQGPPPPQKDVNPQHARLNALLASGEGMDTFGNTGDLRIPAQHTAPGTFVNSAGQGLNRLHATQTGNNPFFNQQFTGAPQQQAGQPGFGGQQAQNPMMPAQTGPAGMNGFGGGFGQTSNNPFGMQQRQGQPQSGSLIDL
ncbi:MAG: hypothetical protein LQ342_004606 [Letrouitia transgressa]|nr:MAG: hypothetical protein LQ342_004606 [Letrouitia transgressa]